MSDGEVYEGAESVIEILKRIGEGKTVKDLFDELQNDYEVLDESERELIIKALNTLLRNRIINVL